MDELIKKLMDQAGVTEDVAKKVVEITSKFMKDTMPAGLGEQVAGPLRSGLYKAGDLAKNLGDILGQRKGT